MSLPIADAGVLHDIRTSFENWPGSMADWAGHAINLDGETHKPCDFQIANGVLYITVAATCSRLFEFDIAEERELGNPEIDGVLEVLQMHDLFEDGDL